MTVTSLFDPGRVWICNLGCPPKLEEGTAYPSSPKCFSLTGNHFTICSLAQFVQFLLLYFLIFLLCLSSCSSLSFSNLLLLDGVLFLELQALNLFLVTAGSVLNYRFYRLCIYFLSCSSFCVFLHLSICLLAVNLCIHSLHNPPLRPSHAFVN